MPEERRAKQVGKITWRQLGDTDYAVPESITMQTGDGADLPYRVTITVEHDGDSPRCTGLVIEERPDGEAVTSEGLRRIPVRQLVDWAAGSLLMRINDPSKPLTRSNLSMIDDAVSADDSARAVENDGKAKRRRITDEDLRRLSDVVTRAEASGRSYITMAQLEMGITRDQARQWKRKAIDEGYLVRTKGEQR